MTSSRQLSAPRVIIVRKRNDSNDSSKSDLYRKYVQAFYDNRNQYGIRPEPLNKALTQVYLGLLDLKENRPYHHHSEESAL
jgi:hypothetical protein